MEQPKLTTEQIVFLYESITQNALICEEILRVHNQQRLEQVDKLKKSSVPIFSIISEVLTMASEDLRNTALKNLHQHYSSLINVLPALEGSYVAIKGKNGQQLRSAYLAKKSFQDLMQQMVSTHPALKKDTI